MAKAKYTFDDIKIGDKIITTSNDEGTVIAIKSIEYLNDKLLRKMDKNNKVLIDLLPFYNDGVRHKDVWYSTITIAVLDKTVKKPTYYLIGIDFSEVKEVIKDMSNIKVTLWDKIKKLLKL